MKKNKKIVIDEPDFTKDEDEGKIGSIEVVEKTTKPSTVITEKGNVEPVATDTAKTINLGLGMDLHKYFDGQVVHKGTVPYNVSKDVVIDLNVRWLSKIVGKRDHATISIQEFRVRLLAESNQSISLKGTTMLAVPGEKELYEKYGTVSDEKATINWPEYYKQIVKFRFRIEFNGYTAWKMPRERTIHIVKNSILSNVTADNKKQITVNV